MRKAANLMVARGLRVQYASGWESRSNGYSFNPTVGFVDHHTAATSDIDNVLINGRSDLPGPLCNWALHKDGSWVLIAAGGANHAGQSQPGAPTNSTGWGCEATGPIPLDGYGPSAFPNYDEYVTGMACILEAESWAASKIWGHKESCSPSGRKIDPSFDMNSFRSSIGAGGTTGGDWFDMATEADLRRIVKEECGVIYQLLANGDGANVGPDKDTHPQNFKRTRQEIADLKTLSNFIWVGDGRDVEVGSDTHPWSVKTVRQLCLDILNLLPDEEVR
jgi:hypothetical protein